ncbi:MAG: AAA family ATPase [Lewinellaceae bacterium]|nr:AAA family ATPase [Lewinellaceae bacterium]
MILKKHFEQIWTQLRAKQGTVKEFLEEVTIRELRGISDLSVRFRFPLTVLAGPNACGKSTVLFACACAYQVPGAKVKDFSPATLFPNLTTKTKSRYSDKELPTVLQFRYIHNGKSTAMQWAKGKQWNRSYLGQKDGSHPQRPVYLRTLANLTSPSEVRSVLQIGQQIFNVETITSDLIAFAQRILPFQYSEMALLKKGGRSLLFAFRENDQYSEFHMSAGERALLRISREISPLKNALILIDEIEAGLHPYTQQQIMLELQRLALRNDLQIIVTSHSPVILDCVPVEGRIFLERTNDNVEVRPPYRDIIQKAFYGQALEKLNVLCEDDVAEAFLLGIMDYLNPKLGLIPSDIKVGRDTGKTQFEQHIEALGKFQLLDDFLFVLDGDAKNLENALIAKASKDFGVSIQPLFVPGQVPEDWAWAILQQHSSEYAQLFGITAESLTKQLKMTDALYASATDKPTEKIKNKYFSFCDRELRRSHLETMRMIARKEAERESGDIKVFLDEFEAQIRRWQNR